MYQVFIRADGGRNIGMGHIMRCISLGKVFLNQGFLVTFISKYKEGIEIIIENGFKVITLEEVTRCSNDETGFFYGDVNDLELEKIELLNILKINKVDILIIDHYNINEKFFIELKAFVKILTYIDDMNAFTYPVDVVINGNITGKYLDYKGYTNSQLLLLGPDYNLIRQEFNNMNKRIPSKQVKSILVTCGGSDIFGITEQLVDIIRSENKLDNIDMHLIIGKGFDSNSIENIKDKQRLLKSIFTYENEICISKIMLKCDIAISSCGSTLYELCACGIPTLGFILADNQRFIAEKMSEHGYIKNLGWYNQLNSKKVINELTALINDYDDRERIIRRQQVLVDGKGTERIVCEITKLLEKI